MQRFVSEYGVSALDHIADESGSIWADYGVTSQPAFVFIDATGEAETIISSLGPEGLAEKIADLTA